MKNASIAIVVLVTLFALSTIIIVDETEQIVILQFGKPVRTIKDAGLNWKLPAPFQTSNSFEKRLLEYDVPPEEILSKDKKSLNIDNYVRWRIVDPLLFLQTVKAVPTAKTRLDDIVYSELRQELGTHDMVEIITENRELIMDKVTIASNEETSKYGIEGSTSPVKMKHLSMLEWKQNVSDKQINSGLKVKKKHKRSELLQIAIRPLF